MQSGSGAPGWIRALLLLGGMACLVSGIWGGLLRAQVLVPLPVEHANWLTFHGPLMVCGFLGTVISLERAVGLGRWWTFFVPALAAGGGLSFAFGALSATPRWLLTIAAAGFVAVTLRIWRIQPALSNAVMSCGAACWFTGNLLWAGGLAVPQVVLWWVAFLLLTIIGERIELTRFQKPHPAARPWLWTALGVLGAGLVLNHVHARLGGVLVGAALAGLALWLGRFDLARHTVRQPGLARFMGLCLLSGYVWLLIGGGLMLARWPQSSGVWYDALLHAFFVGFVFSMIFGHAPVIFPSVLGLPARFWPTAYGPVALLHASVVLRLAGDLCGSESTRRWGAVANAVAVGLFLVQTAASIVVSLARRGAPAKSAAAPTR